ncbi:MAG: levansucrase [Pseudomonadota bacterium]
MLALDDKWIWDSWYVRDGDLWHCFFLQAPKSIGDPELRHWNVTYGHATSANLLTWEHHGTCFAPSDGPAWDDYTTWTGSVVRGDDGQWHLFYTGTSRAEDGKHQKLGHAVSDDLHNWQRVGDGLILDRDDRYEEFEVGRWHDRAFRDPWVLRDPDGDGWLMYFTARNAAVTDRLEAGAIGFATSDDLFTWRLEDPVYTGSFGELEVPQVFQWGGHWYCLFCSGSRFWSGATKAALGAPRTGAHYLLADSPRGPWRLGPAPLLDDRRYAPRIVETADGPELLGFLIEDEGAPFIGAVSDPVALVRAPDGALRLACTLELGGMKNG